MPLWNPDPIQIGEPVISGTSGSVLFVGASSLLSQDNTNFFWDDTNNRLGIQTATPAYPLDVNGAAAFRGVPYAIASTGNNAQGIGTNQIITTAYSVARGMNLVTNGFGLMGNAYNFTGASGGLDTVEVYAGVGSFKESISTSGLYTDESIPVDPNKFYVGTVWVKSTTLSTNNFFYGGVTCLDADGLAIVPTHHMKVSGSTDTTLAADLNAGATTMSLTSATGWYNGATAYSRHFAWYPYTNGKGYTYPDYTYTRNTSRDYYDAYTVGTWANGGISGTTVTLTSAWTGPNLPAGTKVRNITDGNTFKYFMGYGAVLGAWTKFTGVIGEVDTSGENRETYFSPGTAYVKLVFLLNYPGSGSGNVMNVSAIHFSEITPQNVTTFKPADTYRNSTSFFKVADGAGTSILSVDTTNNRVGILNATPAYALDVTGTANVSGALSCGTIDTGNGAVELAAGTYTPTLTNTTNISASTAYQCQYSRVGATVTVSGMVDIDPTTGSSTNTQLTMTLPIASSAPNTEDIAGTAVCSEIASYCGAIAADGSGKAILEFKALDDTSRLWFFTFTYQIN